MSLANEQPELLDHPEDERGIEPRKGENFAIPLKSLSKDEIATGVMDWLNSALEHHPASDLYVMLKQAEEAVSLAIEKLKENAFNAIGNIYRGQANGFILNHEVKLSWPNEWIYSQAVDDLKDKQKLELKALQTQEQANGIAKKHQKEGRITVILRKEGK